MIEDRKLWEPLRVRLDRKFEVLARQVKQCNPRMHWSCYYHRNEAFPFRATARFEDFVGDDDVVISVDCRLSNGNLLITSDIARDPDGYVFVDGPARTLSLKLDPGEIDGEILDTFEAIEHFLEAHLDLLYRELCPSPDGKQVGPRDIG